MQTKISQIVEGTNWWMENLWPKMFFVIYPYLYFYSRGIYCRTFDQTPRIVLCARWMLWIKPQYLPLVVAYAFFNHSKVLGPSTRLLRYQNHRITMAGNHHNLSTVQRATIKDGMFAKFIWSWFYSDPGDSTPGGSNENVSSNNGMFSREDGK